MCREHSQPALIQLKIKKVGGRDENFVKSLIFSVDDREVKLFTWKMLEGRVPTLHYKIIFSWYDR